MGPFDTAGNLVRQFKLMRLLQLLRVKQYSKNVFVFAALFFTRGFVSPNRVLLTLAAVAVMCLVGSATYIVNDIADIERDRAHAKKRNRPIASGDVSIPFAISLALICGILGLVLAYAIRPQVFGCAVFYLGLQALYNLKLKHVPIADVFVIASGFVLRVIIGAVAIQAQLSGWILVCSASLALLVGFGKRRSEFIGQGEDRVRSRESMKGYSLQSLDALVVSSASVAIMCYGLYGIESPTAKQYPGLILTIPFVAFGIFRYMMLIFADAGTAEPESIVFKDLQLAVTFILFLGLAAWALTGVKIGILG
jgi:4-hydroxybenzoate polyprenyltransferase